MVPIYKQQVEQTQGSENKRDVNYESSLLETIAEIVNELQPVAGSLLTTHRVDYAEKAFQRKMRAQANEKKGRRM